MLWLWLSTSWHQTIVKLNNIAAVSKLTGIGPDEPIGIPSDQPARWLAVGAAMAIQENGPAALDYFAMLRGWTIARENI